MTSPAAHLQSDKSTPVQGAFDFIDGQVQKAQALLRTGAERESLPAPAWRGLLKTLSGEILKASEAVNPAPLLAGLLTCRHGTPAARHALHLSYLCALSANRLELSLPQREALVSAALIADIGMYELKNHLDGRRRDQLTDEERAGVQSHTTDSVCIARDLGIRDTLLLTLIAYHHEDGTGASGPIGFPLLGSQYRPHQLLALLDRLTALLRHRSYRPNGFIDPLFECLPQERASQFDPSITNAVLAVLGGFPPGALVRLRSGGVAVVVESADREVPRMFTINPPNGVGPEVTVDTKELAPAFGVGVASREILGAALNKLP